MKKLLGTALAMIMMFSMLTIGVSAQESTAFEEPPQTREELLADGFIENSEGYFEKIVFSTKSDSILRYIIGYAEYTVYWPWYVAYRDMPNTYFYNEGGFSGSLKKTGKYSSNNTRSWAHYAGEVRSN